MPLLQAEKMATNAAKTGLEATIFIFWLKNTVFSCKNTNLLSSIFLKYDANNTLIFMIFIFVCQFKMGRYFYVTE